MDAVTASVAALAALIKAAEERADSPGADLLRELADACLDGLAEVARLEARTAVVKVRLAAEYAKVSRAWLRWRRRLRNAPCRRCLWSRRSLES